MASAEPQPPAQRDGAAGPARRSFLSLLTAAAGAAGLGGCVTLPSSGQVHRAQPVVERTEALVQTADLPLVGAEPPEIVAGFLRACAAGPNDAFATARQYLVGPLASSWWPERLVRLYPHLDSPSITLGDSGAVQVTVPVQAEVDGEGVYRLKEPTEDGALQVSYTLTRDAENQWRIAQAPEGVLLPAYSFSSSFICVPVLFLTPDGSHWVADSRWVPARNAVSRVVSRILGGPSAPLQGVAAALPLADLELEQSAGAAVVSGVATVELRSAQRHPAGILSQLAAQVHMSLSTLDVVEEVRVLVNNELVPPAPGLPTPFSDPGRVVLLAGGAVVRGLGGDREVLTDLGPLGGSEVSHPVLGLDGTLYAVNGRSLVRLVPGAGTASTLYSTADPQAGQDVLLPPVVDADGWVWTGRDGRLSVVNGWGAAHNLEAGWLEGEVVAFDLSAEAGRVALLVATPAGARVAVCAVRREGGDAHPRALLDPQWLNAPDATALAWADPVTVAVLLAGNDGGHGLLRLHVVGGPFEDVPTVVGATSLAGSRTDGTLLACDTHSVLWRRSGSSWHEVDTGCRYPSYPLPGTVSY